MTRMLSIIVAAAALAATPADEVRAALTDAETISASALPGVRYVSLYAIPKEDRAETAIALDYALNAVSRSRAIGRVKRVGTSETLYRFSIIQYAFTNEDYSAWRTAWEKLGESDPWFHVQTEVLEPKTQKRETKTILGGWTSLDDHQKLAAMLQSDAPILRADYVIANALITPRYYEFIGIPATEKEFFKSIGVDSGVIDKLRANAGANLVKSGITDKGRRVIFEQGPRGGCYKTLDVKKVTSDRDPIRRPISDEGLDFKFDASEVLVVAPNGLFWAALYDGDGKLQQSVPDKIAKDTSDPHGDGIVYPVISCIRCHKEGGLRPFKDDQITLLKGKVALNSYKPEIVQRAAEFYDEERLQRQMEFDRETYEQACERATGLTAEKLSASLTKVFGEYAYTAVTPDRAAAEIGLSLDEFRQVLAASNDPILLRLAINGQTVLRDQWASSFQEAALAAETWRARN